MSKLKFLTIAFIATGILFSNTITAQEEESSSPFDAGLDIYSSYIWRGSKFGTGPAFQPWVEAGFGNFAVGAWGSVNAGAEEALEMDLYLGYSFDFGLSLTVTDYYFGGDWTDFNTMHYIEPSIAYEIGDFSFTAAYMLMAGAEAIDAVAGDPGSPAVVNADGTITPAVDAIDAVIATDAIGIGEEGDMYFEAAYSFKNASLAIGAGDGAYTATDDDPEGGFNICNVSFGASKDIEITEKFALPLSGAVTLNPATGGFFITVGVSF